jgi:NADPH:quinone reductase-like Zn-dependent oxidoreductase
LIQAAAGGVGLYLVQLAKILGVKKVITLASSNEKTDLVTSLGADVAINYGNGSWTDQVREAAGGNGVDIVLEAACGPLWARAGSALVRIAGGGTEMISSPSFSSYPDYPVHTRLSSYLSLLPGQEEPSETTMSI